jgi:hypothetical protein
MLVNQIACEEINPRIRDAVLKLVGALEDKYNEHHPYNVMTAGAWMDDMRSDAHYSNSKLHSIDASYTLSGTRFMEPAPPHALSGLGQAVATPKSSRSSD